MKLRTDEMAVVAGMRGSGKTTLIKRLASGLQVPHTIYDPLDQYASITEHRIVPNPDNLATFEATCERIWRQGNHLFIVEEAEVYLKNKAELTHYAKLCILRGRNRGIGIWICTRRIADLHKTPVSQANHLFLYKMFLPNDIAYLSQFIPKDAAINLGHMQPFYFLHYSEGQTELCNPVSPL